MHTPPTKLAIGELERADFNIDFFNTEWQKHVRNIFSRESQDVDDGSYFDGMFNTFLDTDNRFSKAKTNAIYGVFSESQAKKFHDANIKRIIY